MVVCGIFEIVLSGNFFAIDAMGDDMKLPLEQLHALITALYEDRIYPSFSYLPCTSVIILSWYPQARRSICPSRCCCLKGSRVSDSSIPPSVDVFDLVEGQAVKTAETQAYFENLWQQWEANYSTRKINSEV